MILQANKIRLMDGFATPEQTGQNFGSESLPPPNVHKASSAESIHKLPDENSAADPDERRPNRQYSSIPPRRFALKTVMIRDSGHLISFVPDYPAA